MPTGLRTPSTRLESLPPPTLAPAANLVSTPTPPPAPSESPIPISAAASPERGTGIYPIISNIQPPPGGSVAGGDVTIGARVTGASNLTQVIAFVDGEPIQQHIGPSPSRSMTFSFVRQLADGPHEVRVEARDERGQTGGYRWQFNVGARPGSAPARADLPTPRAVPTVARSNPPATPQATAVASPAAKPAGR